MADMNALVHIKDENGNVNNIFPATKIANVEGLQTALNTKANTSDVTSGLAGKVDKETGKGLSTNDYTTTEKNKLAGIEAQANKTVVDDALSSSSTNPVQNNIITAALNDKAPNSDFISAVSDLETEIATQTARIDAIASLPSGSTSGDAELMDIRVKADGTSAANAGTAVREQISGITKNINDNVLTFSIHNNNRLWSNDFDAPEELRITQTDSNYEFYLLLIDKNDQTVEEFPTSWTNHVVYDRRIDVAKIRLIMHKKNNANFTSADEGVASLIIQQIKSFSNDVVIKRDVEFEQGSVDSTGKISSTTRIRTKDVIHVKAGSRIICPSGYKYAINRYNKFGVFQSDSGWKTAVTRFDTDDYIMLAIANSSNTEIDIGAASGFKFDFVNNKTSNVDVTMISLPKIGDAIILQFAESGETMLIDMGREEDYSIVKAHLKSKGISKIEYLMISHYHEDHVSAAAVSSLISDFDCTNMVALLPPTIPDSYIGNQWTPGAAMRAVQSAVKTILSNANIPYLDSYYPQGRRTIYIGGVPFKLYNTDQTEAVAQNYDYNDLSLVALMINDKISMLFTGDMMTYSAPSITDDMEQCVTICKLGHHGLDNKNNTPIKSYQKIRPEFFVASSPADTTTYANNYANSGAIRFANYNNIPLIMTGYSGDIELKISQDGYSVNGKNHRLDTLTSEEFFDYVL